MAKALFVQQLLHRLFLQYLYSRFYNIIWFIRSISGYRKPAIALYWEERTGISVDAT